MKTEKIPRYPGISPFNTAQQAVFFGREGDSQRLYELVKNEQQVLLYAKSGAGKSSLIQAGLLPFIDKRSDYRVSLIRFNSFLGGNSTEPIITMVQSFTSETPNSYIDKIFPDENSLWYHFKKRQEEAPLIHLLVFDQFEELFTYPPEQIYTFKKQLGELLYSAMPQKFRLALQKLMKNNPDILTEEEFYQLNKPLKVKALYSIRADRISLMNHLTDHLPDITRVYFELCPLSRLQAREAIARPAQMEGHFVSSKFEYTEEALEHILNYLTNSGHEHVETTQLQIICQRIERSIKLSPHSGIAIPKVEVAEIPDLNNILLNFYTEAIGSIKPEEQESARKLIEDHLIRDNTRLALDEIICWDFLSATTLGLLVDARLLHAGRTSSGRLAYELSHDTLIAPIQAAAKERRRLEEDIRREQIRQEELRRLQLEKEREERERAKIQIEKDRADRLLEKSKRLLRHLVQEQVSVVYEYFVEKARNELEYCRFDQVAQYYLFAWLAFDLPEHLDHEMKQNAELFKKLAELNQQAINAYRNEEYETAAAFYSEILQFRPNDEIIKCRLDYCSNPVFSRNKFVLVKGGEFIMGDGSDSDNPPHKIQLSDFFISKYQTTNAEFAEFLNIYGSDRILNGDHKDENIIAPEWFGVKKIGKIWKPAEEEYAHNPVVRVTWFGAREYCRFWNLSLPTEAQWEYSARSRGLNHKYSWGNEEPRGSGIKTFGSIADESLHRKLPEFTTFEKGYDDGYVITSPVGSFEPNELGLYDMSGNVWEWCEDAYDGNYYNYSQGLLDPVNLTKTSLRIIRGGSSYSTSIRCRVAFRNYGSWGDRYYYLGFRPVRNN